MSGNISVSWSSGNNCSESESVSTFINATDPAYFTYQQMNIIISLTLGACGIFMNSSMICAYWKTYQKTALGLLFLQLFISNLCVAVFCLITDGIWISTIQWNGGDFLCRIVKFAQMFSLYATTFILTSISIETCVTLTFPLTMSQRQVSFFRVKLLSGSSWILASISSVPQERAYAIATSFLKCLLPLSIITFCYVTIVVKMSSEARMILRQNGSKVVSHAARQGTRLYQQTRRISLWMSLVTSAAFVICWAPYYTTMIAHLFKHDVSHELEFVTFCFGTTFCVLNPIVYGGFVVCKQMNKKSQEIIPPDGSDWQQANIPLIQRSNLPQFSPVAVTLSIK